MISTKRDELSKICDHMNIQVDNPMNILTQGEENCHLRDIQGRLFVYLVLTDLYGIF